MYQSIQLLDSLIFLFGFFPPEMVFRKILVSLMGCLGISNQPTQLARPEISESSSDDPLIISPRIRLSDGRFLAYEERGVPKSKSSYRIIIVHGFGSSKDMNFLAPQVNLS